VAVSYSLAFGKGGQRVHRGGGGPANFPGAWTAHDEVVPGSPGFRRAQIIPPLAFVSVQDDVANHTRHHNRAARTERWRFGAFVQFIVLWSILVTARWRNWVSRRRGWGPTSVEPLDFAGGTVVTVILGGGGWPWRWFSAAEWAGPGSGCGDTTWRSPPGGRTCCGSAGSGQTPVPPSPKPTTSDRVRLRQHQTTAAAGAPAELGLRGRRGSLRQTDAWARPRARWAGPGFAIIPVRATSITRLESVGGLLAGNFGCVARTCPWKNRLQDRTNYSTWPACTVVEEVIGS